MATLEVDQEQPLASGSRVRRLVVEKTDPVGLDFPDPVRPPGPPEPKRKSAPPKILLVDEDPDDRALAIRLLRKEYADLRLTQVWDQERFDEALKGKPYDLVITDFHLLWADGLQVLRQVQERWPSCPVIMFTGVGNEDVALQAMKLGLADYVVKHPVHFARLPVVAQRALAQLDSQRSAREAEGRWRRLFEDLPIGLYRTTPGGLILEANHALRHMLRYPAEKSIRSLDTAEVYMDRGRRAQWLALLDDHGVVKDFEAEFRRFDGRRIWVRENTRAVYDERGEILCYEGSLEDITAHKLAERALRSSEQELGAVFDHAPLMMMLLDQRLRIRKVNLAVADYAERTQSELLDKSVGQTLRCLWAEENGDPGAFSPSCRRCPICRCAENSVMNGMVHQDVEVCLPVRLGEEEVESDFEVTTSPMSLQGQRMLLLCLQDITQQKLAAQEALESRDELERAMGGVINALVEMLATRDPYTAGHQQRVASLASAIALEMGLDERVVAAVRMAAIIHDLGKVAVPSEILTKPSRLTRLEFDIMKMHPQVGFDILSKLEFPWPVSEVALQHHERLDGSGYPNGIRGEEIRLEARVIAVADVVEAMASHRPYRPSLGIKRALEEIHQQKGMQYDPDVVEACVRLAGREGFALV